MLLFSRLPGSNWRDGYMFLPSNFLLFGLGPNF